LPGIQRAAAGGIERHRVHQHPFWLTRGGGQQHPVLLAGLAADEELPLTAADRGADIPGGHQLLDPVGQRCPAGQDVQLLTCQRVLRGQPVPGRRAGRVFQPAVRVGDGITEEILGAVEALGRG
jgi:hypothetical protein